MEHTLEPMDNIKEMEAAKVLALVIPMDHNIKIRNHLGKEMGKEMLKPIPLLQDLNLLPKLPVKNVIASAKS